MSIFNPNNPKYTSVEDEEYWQGVFEYGEQLAREEKYEKVKKQCNCTKPCKCKNPKHKLEIDNKTYTKEDMYESYWAGQENSDIMNRVNRTPEEWLKQYNKKNK